MTEPTTDAGAAVTDLKPLSSSKIEKITPPLSRPTTETKTVDDRAAERLPLTRETSTGAIEKLRGGNFFGGERSLPLYTANLTELVFLAMANSAYSIGVTRTLERRFELSSSATGLMNSCDEISHVCVVGFVGYFGGKGHIPRIVSVTVALLVASTILMASPLFVL